MLPEQQNPLSVLLSTVLGGLAANRQAQDAAQFRQYQLQRQQQLDTDKHNLDESNIGKNTAEGTRYAAQTQNENAERVRKNVEFGIGTDGKSTLPPLQLPAPGKDGSPAPLAATLAAIRQAQLGALQQGATQIANGYEGVASGLAQQANQEAARAEKAIQDQAQRQNWSQQRINQERQIKQSEINARISAQARVQAAAVGSGSIAGAMRANNIDTNATRVNEGALNRSFQEQRQNVNNAYNFSVKQYDQGQINQRFDANSTNKAINQNTFLKSVNPKYNGQPYSPSTPQDFAPTPAPVVPTGSDDDSNPLQLF